jgi:hypothetical protein
MTNPFESSATQRTKNLTLEYHNNAITVESGENYRLTWPDGRWLIMNCQEDYSKTQASTDADTRHIIPCQWTVESTSGGPDWINREQLQVVGELIGRKEKEQELHASK